MMKIFKAYKYRLYPTKTQESYLRQQIGNSRFIWNQLLAANNKVYEEAKKFLWYHQLNDTINELKQEFDFLKLSNSQSLQQTAMQLDSALKDLKHGKGYPKFKPKRLGGSFQVPQHFAFKKNKVFIPKSEKKLKDRWIRFEKHRKFEGTIKSVTVSLDVDRWYISVLTEHEIEVSQKVGPTVGVDLGIESFLTLDDGSKITNPKLLKRKLDKLDREQRRLAKKVKGSNNRYKQQKVVAGIHRKVRDSRNDFQHRVSSLLTAKAATICVEDLAVRNMVKNRKLSRAISDVGWSGFITKLEYKASWYGVSIIKADRWYPSSKTCSNCGNVKKKLSLRDRIYNCPVCGLKIDRDVNAAINLSRLGDSRSSSKGLKACGDTSAGGLETKVPKLGKCLGSKKKKSNIG